MQYAIKQVDHTQNLVIMFYLIEKISTFSKNLHGFLLNTKTEFLVKDLRIGINFPFFNHLRTCLKI